MFVHGILPPVFEELLHVVLLAACALSIESNRDDWVMELWTLKCWFPRNDVPLSQITRVTRNLKYIVTFP